MAPWEYRHGGKERKLTPKMTPEQEELSSGCCDCSGNPYNCSDFKSRADAQACYEHCLSLTGKVVHRLDGNGDGEACEATP